MIPRANVFSRYVDSVVEKVKSRWSLGWRDALASAIAAALAWIIARHFFGHIHPVFAAISAVVCLAPGLPSHGKQAVGLMVGVATGIIVGEAALWLPDAYPLLRLGFATFSAIAIAALLCGCATTTTVTTAPAGQAPVCQPQSALKATVLWQTHWRADQKDVPEREAAAARGMADFFAGAACFPTTTVARADADHPAFTVPPGSPRPPASRCC